MGSIGLRACDVFCSRGRRGLRLQIFNERNFVINWQKLRGRYGSRATEHQRKTRSERFESRYDRGVGQAAVSGAFDWLAAMIEKSGEISVNMAEGKILIEQMPIDERNPMVAKFAGTFSHIHV